MVRAHVRAPRNEALGECSNMVRALCTRHASQFILQVYRWRWLFSASLPKPARAELARRARLRAFRSRRVLPRSDYAQTDNTPSQPPAPRATLHPLAAARDAGRAMELADGASVEKAAPSPEAAHDCAILVGWLKQQGSVQPTRTSSPRHPTWLQRSSRGYCTHNLARACGMRAPRAALARV